MLGKAQEKKGKNGVCGNSHTGAGPDSTLHSSFETGGARL